MNNIYKKRSNAKIFLVILGCLILLITLVYSNYLADSLREVEEKNYVLYNSALDSLLNNNEYNKDMTFQDKVVRTFALPVIFKDDQGMLVGYNFSENQNTDQEFLKKKVESFLSSGKKPHKSLAGGYVDEVYYFNSPLLNYIRFYPIVQLLLVVSFISLGYFLFSSSRKAEQNRVWVGMAKETAHQLGTPISAIIAWIQYLKENTTLDDDQKMVVTELQKDVNRLDLVADRFSKIGSAPELTQTDLVEQIRSMQKYMSQRAAKNIVFDYKYENTGKYFSDINAHLFDWVVENLMRNSLDSMGGKGTLSYHISLENNNVLIEFSDTGKGIEHNRFKTIFQPGYSTKKRGWGLGLSLSKRIIEEYHKGKIYVKNSVPHEKTTFVISLPASETKN